MLHERHGRWVTAESDGGAELAEPIDRAVRKAVDASGKRFRPPVTARAWTGQLEYAFIKIAGTRFAQHVISIWTMSSIRENTTGRFIYRRVIGPGVNSLGGTNCGKVCIGSTAGQETSSSSMLADQGFAAGSQSGRRLDDRCRTDQLVSRRTGLPPCPLGSRRHSRRTRIRIAATNRALRELGRRCELQSDRAQAMMTLEYGQRRIRHLSLGDSGPRARRGRPDVSGAMCFASAPIITVGDVTATSGSLDVVYRPDSLYSPPPGLTGS